MNSTKDLQIGNWLYDISGMPKKVDDISDDGVSLGGVYNHISNIKPIPLTAEILRKNGLREDRPNVMFRLREWHGDAFDYISIHFSELSGNTTSVCVEHGDENGEIRRVQIGGSVFVHELQNALSLVGIEKSITV